MKVFFQRPAMPSIVCSSKPLPSVAVTSAWVSPRVKSATPWGRGTGRVSQAIGRIWSLRRPSMRSPVASTRSRIDLAAEVVQDVADLATRGSRVRCVRASKSASVRGVELARCGTP